LGLSGSTKGIFIHNFLDLLLNHGGMGSAPTGTNFAQHKRSPMTQGASGV
jgi:hypothetical protein